MRPLLWLTVAALSCGCGNKTTGTANSAAPDSLGQGEVAESGEFAFGLVLPRGMTVRTRVGDRAEAAGILSFDGVVRFLRERVDAETVTTGPQKTRFEKAVVKTQASSTDAGADEKPVLTLEVSQVGSEVRLAIWARTTPKRRTRPVASASGEPWKFEDDEPLTEEERQQLEKTRPQPSTPAPQPDTPPE